MPVMSPKKTMKYSVSLEFESINLPPFKDILILGKRCPHGKIGVSKCFNLLAPDDFDLVDIKHDNVEAILVNKTILKRLPKKEIVKILEENVFPYVTNGEIIKVDFKVRVSYEKIAGSL